MEDLKDIMSRTDEKSERAAWLPDMSDAEEVRKAFVMSEILNRRYE